MYDLHINWTTIMLTHCCRFCMGVVQVKGWVAREDWAE